MSTSEIGNRKTEILFDLAAIGLIAALVLLFFWRIVTPRLEDRAVFPPGDFTDQFWMFRQYQTRAFAEGRLPLWSENFNSGHPFLADVQSAVFYPISLVWTLIVVATRGANFTLLDLEIEAIFHFILAGAFTYWFAKRLLGARLPALLSAVTFTFGGYLTSYPPQQLAILETATWLPLILLLLDHAVTASTEGAKQSPSHTDAYAASSRSFDSATKTVAPLRMLLAMTKGIRYFIAAGIALGIAALAGHPQTLMFVGYASIVFFGWRVSQNSEFKIQNSPPLRILNLELRLWNSSVTVYALQFTLVFLIAAGIASAQWIPSIEYQSVSTRAAISWPDAATGFPTLDPLQMILPGYASAFQVPLYIGVSSLWLALFALFIHRSRHKSFWILLALGALIVSFGAYVFGYALFYLFVPGFAMFRGQERLAFIISFSFAILAGYGFRDLIQPSFDAKHARRAWALLPAGVVASVLMLFTMFIAAREHQTGRLFFLTDRAALMTLLFTLATVLMGWGLRKPSRIFIVLVFVFIAFDLFSINNAAYNAEPKPRFPATPLIASIKNDPGIFRVVDEGTQPGHFGIAYGLEEIGGISPLRISHYDKLLDALPAEKLWRLLNVRYVLTKRPGFTNAEAVAQDGETRLLRLQNETPRAWFVTSAQANVDDQTALAAMLSDSFDPRQVAYLAGELSLLNYPDAARNSAQVVLHEPEHLVIAVDASVDAVLMVSQVYYPSWIVTIDGVPVQTRRADVALTAVPVQKGARQIEFNFDSRSVKVGIAITILTIIATMILLWRSR